MEGAACISLLTDFGLADGFVAACHGVAARIAPRTRVIDITHEVPRGDVRRGAAVLAQTIPYLPRGIHVAVVDPGVGTSRRAVAIGTGTGVFIGPDNGVLSWAVRAAGGASSAYELTNSELWQHPTSNTFHGRDVFTSVAAHLAAGTELETVGDELASDEPVTLPEPLRHVTESEAEGEIVSVDQFGNLQFSIHGEDLQRLGVHKGDTLAVTAGRSRFTLPLLDTYGSVAPDELVAYVDSAGLLAVAVNAGSAAGRLGLAAATPVWITAAP